MLKKPPLAGDHVWVVKVSPTRRVYAQRLTVLVADSRRICVGYCGKRLTWRTDTSSLFTSAAAALTAAYNYYKKQRAAAEPIRRRPARAA